MNKFKLKWLALLGILLVASPGVAASIYTFYSGQTLTASQINSNFQHIHNSLVGSGHTLIVNADVSTSAAIAHTKLATPALLPKAWGHVWSNPVCVGLSTSTCTLQTGSGATSVTTTNTASGQYTVTIPARTDNTYSVVVTASYDVASAKVFCTWGNGTTTTFIVRCFNEAGTTTDVNFDFMLLDNDN